MSKKKTPQQYYNECREHNCDFPIEEYKNKRTKIKFKCKNNHVYLQRPDVHLKGQGCPYCSGLIKKIDKHYHLLECKEKGLDLPIEEYIDKKTPINYKCNKCGYIYNHSPSSHLKGHGCPKCTKNSKKRSLVKNHLAIYKANGYDKPVEDIKGAKIKTKYECDKGHTYFQTPNNHMQGYGCPICKESHGEKFIRKYLESNSIIYESQKKFKDLKDKTYLSYDFYLPKQKILIEYQGIQHYSEKDYFGGKETFKVQQYHDKLKSDYAKKHGYKLLELHYSLDTQEKVNKYLERRLK